MSGRIMIIGGLIAAALATPALAQVDQANSAQPAPVAPNPGTTSANEAVIDAQAAITAEGQAQYESDRAAYLDALAKHDAAVDRTDARYARQQHAYARAMAVWRYQVAACKRGNNYACKAPPPNPAAYY